MTADPMAATPAAEPDVAERAKRAMEGTPEDRKRFYREVVRAQQEGEFERLLDEAVADARRVVEEFERLAERYRERETAALGTFTQMQVLGAVLGAITNANSRFHRDAQQMAYVIGRSQEAAAWASDATD